jgi:hypothetical protein
MLLLLFFIGITVAGAAHDDGDGDDTIVVVGERIVVGLFDEEDDVEDLGERCSPLLFLLPILSPPTPPRGVGKDEEDVVEGPPIFFFFSLSLSFSLITLSLSLSLTLCLCLFSRARRTSKRGPPSSRSLCALACGTMCGKIARTERGRILSINPKLTHKKKSTSQKTPKFFLFFSREKTHLTSRFSLFEKKKKKKKNDDDDDDKDEDGNRAAAE